MNMTINSTTNDFKSEKLKNRYHLINRIILIVYDRI